MLKALLSLLKDESGTTMLEYAVVGGTVIVVGTAAFVSAGKNVSSTMNKVAIDI